LSGDGRFRGGVRYAYVLTIQRMPITEVPTPPGRTPEAPLNKKPSRYDNLETDELLHLIDKLQDERSRARLREGIYISLLAHLVIFLFFLYGPKYLLHQPRIIMPAEVAKSRPEQMTYLDLPPDALKRLKPKTPQAMSDKDRVAQSQHPTLDQKTLEQLQAMRRAGRPAPPSPQPAAPTAQAPAGQPAPRQQAQQQAQQAPQTSTPAPATPKAQQEAPRPQPMQPNFAGQTAGDVIRQAERDAASGAQSAPGDYGAGLTPRHPGLQAGVDILSDTLGVDFGPYLQRVIAATYRSWDPLIPESVRPPIGKQGRVGIEFKILPDGSVKQMILRFPSGDVALDRAAWGGITGASPYPPLPKQFKGPYLALRFAFLYNINPDQLPDQPR
jgi:TonB family protein